MTIHVEKTPECPLCGKKFSAIWNPVLKDIVFVCFPCKVSIRSTDPAINMWDDPNKQIDCPRCSTKMKVFFRSTDEYIKGQCPDKACRGGFESYEPDQDDTTGPLKV